MNLIKALCFTLIFQIFDYSAGNAQSCTETLNLAREEFDAGHLYTIPSLLKPCIDNGFNKDQQIQAYWLLTRTYLFTDDPISAEDSYLKLLKLDPEYRIDPEHDPVDVVYLGKKFRTTPIFVLYARIGANMTYISTIHNYGVDNTSESQENYEGQIGGHIGGGVEVNISNLLSFGIEGNFYNRKYTYNNILFNQDQQTYTENLRGVNFPVYLKYRWDFEKIRPYVYAGYGVDLLLGANASVKLTDKSGTDGQTEFPVTGPQLNIKEQRKTLNTFAHFGGGINYRIGYNYIFIDFRYMTGLSNIVDEERQYQNSDLIYKYGYVDDDKRLNNISVSLGFVKPLYKPRKIKKQSAGMFFGKIWGKNK